MAKQIDIEKVGEQRLAELHTQLVDTAGEVSNFVLGPTDCLELSYAINELLSWRSGVLQRGATSADASQE